MLNGWLLQNRWVKCLMKLSCMNVSLALSEEVIVLLILWLICSSPYTFYSVEDIQDADGLWLFRFCKIMAISHIVSFTFCCSCNGLDSF